MSSYIDIDRLELWRSEVIKRNRKLNSEIKCVPRRCLMFRVFTGCKLIDSLGVLVWAWGYVGDDCQRVVVTEDLLPTIIKFNNFKEVQYANIEDALEVVKNFYDCNIAVGRRSLNTGEMSRYYKHYGESLVEWRDKIYFRDMCL